MKFLLKIKDEDVGLKSVDVLDWIKREAARCILRRKDNIALLNVRKHSYHKLPGGGVDAGESVEEALHKEVEEEVGSKIKIDGFLGSVAEYKSKSKIYQISQCFLATETAKGVPNYTEKEIENEFKLEWHSLKDAIKLLKDENPDNYSGKFIVKRDLRFLQEAEKFLGS